MSAYIVSNRTINTIVSYLNDQVIYPSGSLSEAKMKKIGKYLMSINVKSIRARYSEADGTVEMENYVFKKIEKVSHLTVIGCISCLQYQCCEFEGWEKSSAYNLLNRIGCDAFLNYTREIEIKIPWGVNDNVMGF